MDANLVARELEMTLLAKLLERSEVNAGSNLTMPAAVLLHLLRTYLGPEISMCDLQEAARISPLLSWTPYAKEIEVADIRSDQGVCLTVFRWNKYATTSKPYRQILSEHVERPRPPIASTNYRGGPLGIDATSFDICNEGYGTQADVVVRKVTVPDWIAAKRRLNKVSLSACPADGGVYRGKVVISTNANDVILPVSTESAAFKLPERNELTLEELIPQHPDIDREATERLLERILRQMKFERLPGGLFIRHGAPVKQERSNDWWLSEAEILTGCLAGTGYPASFTVYADADGKVDKYSEEVIAEHGQLGGLADLFECLDVQIGQRLCLKPYRGGYKVLLSPAEPWRTAKGHTFWLQGPTTKVVEHAEVLESLVHRADDKNITVNLLLSGTQTLPPDLIRQHRAGRLTIRFTEVALPYRLIVCDEECAAYVPPYGGMQRPATPPQALWDASVPLEGRDYREQAWQRRSEGGEGLLDLELSVAMAKLAQALEPVPVKVVKIDDAQRRRLQVELPVHARQLGIGHKPLLAGPILKRHGVRVEQVNAHAPGIRVTAGGYLVLLSQDLGGQRDWARYIVNLYGGVIHHSQLRKLVEAFKGRPLEADKFRNDSLHLLGWGGNGYRRPKQPWEPAKRELTPFVAEVLAHFESRQEALSWLRRNVAASEVQLERALSKAAPLVAGFEAKKAAALAQNSRSSAVQNKATPKSTKTSPVRSTTALSGKSTPAAGPTPFRRQVNFAPLAKIELVFPDPRHAPSAAVQQAVTHLIKQEGPISESWLLRRYAAQARCNVRLIQAKVLETVADAADRGDVERLEFPCGHVEYLIPGQKAVLRERGTRSVEDISFGEWCELLHALGLTSPGCDEAQAHREATQAYKFGTDAGRVRSLVGIALAKAQRI